MKFGETDRIDFDAMIEDLLESEYLVIDILPETAGEDDPERYFRIEKYFRENRQIANDTYDRFSRLLLKLNMYFGFLLCDETGTRRPDPGELQDSVAACTCTGWENVLIPDEKTLITLSGGDLYMTVYNISERVRPVLEKLCASEGLFLRDPH